MPEISVIVPIYKAEKYLEQCVESVLAQTYTDFELILVDDGSPDSCPRICDAYGEKDKRVQVIHQSNAGVTSARNAGISSAEGQYIFFLDSDDWIPDDYFEKMLGACEANNADLCIGGYIAFYENETTADIVSDFETAVYSSAAEFAMMFHEYFATIFNFTWGKLFKTKIIRENGIYFPQGMLIAEDVIFNMDYYRKCKRISVLNEPRVYYRQVSGSLSHKYSDKTFEWYHISYTAVHEFLKETHAFSPENRKHYYASCAGNYIQSAIGLILNPGCSRKEALAVLRETSKYSEVETAFRELNSKSLLSSGFRMMFRLNSIPGLYLFIKLYLTATGLKNKMISRREKQ